MKNIISILFVIILSIFLPIFISSCVPMKPLEMPTNVQVIDVSETSAEIEWSYSGSYDGFEVERKMADGPFKKIATTDTTSFKDKNLQPDTTYYYRIRAYKKLNKSPWSNPVNLITLEAQLKAPTITNIYFDKTERKIKIEWDDQNRSEESFEIRKRSFLGDYEILARDIKNSKFEDPEFLEGLTYQYQVRAKRGEKYSDWSSPFNITIDLPIPESVKNLKIDSITPTSVEISWDCDIEYVTEYEIFRESDDNEVRNLGTTVNKHFIDTSVQQDKVYTYKVYAVRGVSKSYSPAQVLAIVPPNIVLPCVDNFIILSWGSDYVRLSWSYGNHGQTGFEIYRKDGNNGKYKLLTRVSANQKYFTDTGLKSSTRYYYKIRAYNSEGFSDWSVAVTTVTTSSF